MTKTQMQINTENSAKKVCVFTGHRQIEENFNSELFENTVNRFIQEGATTFLTGMAIGFDMFAAEYIVKLKEKDPTLKLCACIPCLNQEKYYSLVDKKRYVTILEKCDEKIILSQNYFQGCMHSRNDFMVEKADCMVAYLLQDNGGTAYTVKRFQKKKPNGEIAFIE